jgi:hypothetical protein
MIIITVPNCQSPAGLANQFGDPTHKSMLSGPLVQEMLVNAGFKKVIYKSKPVQESSMFLKRVLKFITMPIQMVFILVYKITFSVGNTPLAPDIVIYAYK